MITLLEDYVKHLNEVDVKSRTSFSNGTLSYYMPSDTVSPDEWADFDNVYQVHSPHVFIDNGIRDVCFIPRLRVSMFADFPRSCCCNTTTSLVPDVD